MPASACGTQGRDSAVSHVWEAPRVSCTHVCTCVCVCMGKHEDVRMCVFLPHYTLCPHGHLSLAGRISMHTGNYNERVGLNPTDFLCHRKQTLSGSSRNSQEAEREPDAVGGNVNSCSFCGEESEATSEN